MRGRLVVVCLMGAAVSCGGGAVKSGGTGGGGGGTAGASTAGASGDAGATGGAGGAAGSGDAGGAGTAGMTGTAGVAGTAGTTGNAGTTGTAGSRGTAGMGGAPVCVPISQGDVVEFAIVGSDGMPISAPTTAAVSVTSIDSCAQVTCPRIGTVSSGLGISAAASRLTLTAPGPQQWTLYLRDSAMPSDFLKVGDMFDLTIAAGHNSTFYQMNVDQTVVLSRDGNLIFFAAGLDRSFQLATPNLDAFGIQISDAGAFSCPTSWDWLAAVCAVEAHAAHVAVGGDDATLGGGQTSKIGWLSFTNASFTKLGDKGGCDAMSPTIMAGFRTP